MIKDFIKQIKNKNIFVTSIKNNQLKIVKQGINNYSVYFNSQNKLNSWRINGNIHTISLILKTWKSDKKLIKKYHVFEW